MVNEVETGKNVAVAFSLVIGAALSTGVGAAAVFFPSVVKLTSTRVLASSLAFAAGVMIYVSLLEIIVKSQQYFQSAGYSESHSHLYSTLCFFAGILCMMMVEKLVHYLGGGDHKKNQKTKSGDANMPVNVVPHCIGCSEDPVAELEDWHAKAEDEFTVEDDFANDGAQEKDEGLESGQEPDAEFHNNADNIQDTKKQSNENGHSYNSQADSVNTDFEKIDSMEKKRLIQMGASTALAIAIHNFPEGLATFVAALDDPKVGAVLAIALGIHNIPEGLCVALPVYYATGNRMKGFLWGLLSGLTEPIGALIGWLVLAQIMGDAVYAILFGLVAGMMTFISLRELIPTAFRYDPTDSVVTYSTVLGMLVMAASLVLFQL